MSASPSGQHSWTSSGVRPRNVCSQQPETEGAAEAVHGTEHTHSRKAQNQLPFFGIWTFTNRNTTLTHSQPTLELTGRQWVWNIIVDCNTNVGSDMYLSRENQLWTSNFKAEAFFQNNPGCSVPQCATVSLHCAVHPVPQDVIFHVST